jgi:hypothetical protein
MPYTSCSLKFLEKKESVILLNFLLSEILNDRKKSFGTSLDEWLKTLLYNYDLHQFEEEEKMGLPLNFNLIVNDLKNLKKGLNPSKIGLMCMFLVLIFGYLFIMTN